MIITLYKLTFSIARRSRTLGKLVTRIGTNGSIYSVLHIKITKPIA